MAQEKEPKALIDASAARALVEHLIHHRGIDTIRSDDRLAPDASDEAVLVLARAESRTIVTINAEDFRRLARRIPHHPGLVILPSVNKGRQIALAELVMDRMFDDIKAGRRPEGHVYEVDENGVIKRYKLPA